MYYLILIILIIYISYSIYQKLNLKKYIYIEFENESKEYIMY